jgi:GTPase SAR1 family protein
VFLVGNKSDLKEDRKVKKEDCDIAARRYNSKYYEVSAKNGSNILMTFEDMAPRLVEVQLEKQKQSGKESKQKTNLLKLGGKKDKGLFNNNNSTKKCC